MKNKEKLTLVLYTLAIAFALLSTVSNLFLDNWFTSLWSLIASMWASNSYLQTSYIDKLIELNTEAKKLLLYAKEALEEKAARDSAKNNTK